MAIDTVFRPFGLYVPAASLAQDVVNLKVLTMEIEAFRATGLTKAKLLIQRAEAIEERARAEKHPALADILALTAELKTNMMRLEAALQ